MSCLEMGAVQTLIVWENLEVNRITMQDPASEETTLKILTPEQEQESSHFHDAETGVELEVVEKQSMLEWFADEYKKFGCTLEFITNRSQEGSQFCRGFGGIGGILRWRVDFQEMDFDELDEQVGF